MKRNLKALGLALVAAFAMSAVAAPAVSAESVFTATKYPVTLTGETEGSENFFKIDGGEMKCDSITGSDTGTEPAAVAEISIVPQFNGCKAFGLEASVHTNGCSVELIPGEHTKDGSFHGKGGLSCPSEKRSNNYSTFEWEYMRNPHSSPEKL